MKLSCIQKRAVSLYPNSQVTSYILNHNTNTSYLTYFWCDTYKTPSLFSVSQFNYALSKFKNFLQRDLPMALETNGAKTNSKATNGAKIISKSLT